MEKVDVDEIVLYKQHLKTASDLEARVLTYEKLIRMVNTKINQLQSIKYYCDSEEAFDYELKFIDTANSEKSKPKFDKKTKILIVIAAIVFFPAFISGIPLWIIIYFVMKGKKADSNTADKIKKYNHDCKMTQSQNEKEITNQIIAKYEDVKKKIINQRNVAFSNCEKHYQQGNLLPVKYRHDFFAVTTMYEYLDVGICTEIKGTSGIYARYEDDKKWNRIIYEMEKANAYLKRISSKLDVVIENQNTMIGLMQESNRIAEKTFEAVQRIESNSEQANSIAQDTYAKISAINDKYSTSFYFG